MKSNFFKYIFILFIIGIIIYSIYAIYFKKQEEPKEVIQTEEEQIEEKKDLRLAISNYDTINPLISNNREVLNISKLVFEPLLNLTNNYKLEGCLATEWSKISDYSYIIKIDSNKKWQDGKPVTAKDVQFTIDRLKEVKNIYSYNVEKVNGIEILDTNTIKIDLFEPVEFFEYNLTFPILPNHYYIDDDFYNSSKIPIGTGMYKIVSIDSNNITLAKNENWWNIQNSNPKIEQIEIKIFSEVGEVYNSFKLGHTDIFTTSNYNLENYIGTIGYIKHEFKGRQFDYLAVNCENSVLKNVEVRKALAYAIDKNSIISKAYNNNYYSCDFPLDYGNYLYEEKQSNIKFNQDQAKRILLENGWEYKYNRWQKTEDYRTQRINLTLTVNRDDKDRMTVAEIIKNQLEQVGFKISIRSVSKSQYNSILENKNYELLLTGIYNSYSPNIETFFGTNNLENYNNDEIINILNEIKSITDQNLLKEKYDRIIEIYNNEMPFISLYRNKVTVVRSQNLAGEITPNNYFSYYNINTWSRF